MATILLTATAVIILCILLNKVSSKLGFPMLLAFIVLGMIFGSDGLFGINFDNFKMAEEVCSIALIFIMFYGGFGTKWSAAKPVAGKAFLLASAGVVLTAAFTSLFCGLVLKFGVLESMLVGAVTSSTDAASVFSILRSKKLNLKYNTASLLEVESGSNDPCSYMLTIIVLQFMNNEASGFKIVYMMFAQIAYAIVFGVGIAWLAIFILKKFNFETSGFDAAFVLAVAIIAYAAPSAIGGNGYLSTYIAGIILGNKYFPNKKALVHFFDGLTGLMQMLLFFLLGLLSFPSKIPSVVLPALAIAIFLSLVSRPLTIACLMTPFKSPFKQQMVISATGLRGAASIVFAVMAVSQTSALQNDLFHIVFFVVLFSIAFQGSLIPLVSRKMKMIDDEADVLRTFNDYPDEVPVQFIKLIVDSSHPWANHCVKDLVLPPETLLVLVLRQVESDSATTDELKNVGAQNAISYSKIIPRGNTVIQAGDELVVAAQVFSEAQNQSAGISLVETRIEKGHAWVGKTLAELKEISGDKDSENLVVLIKRKGKIVIPKGNTVLLENDVLVRTLRSSE